MKKEGIIEYIGIVIFVALASLVAAGVINKSTSAPETAALALVDDDEDPAPAVTGHQTPEHAEPVHKESEHAEPAHKESEAHAHKEPAHKESEAHAHKEPAHPGTKPEAHAHKEPAHPEPRPEPAAVKAPEPKAPAPAEPVKAPVVAETKPAAAAEALSVTYGLNEDEFELNVTGYGPFGDQTIDFFDCIGNLKMVPGKLETITFDGEISMELMSSKHEKLLKSLSAKEFFNTAEYPEASFQTTSVKKTGDGYEVTGSLEIKGIKKKIKYPATITETDDSIRIVSEFRVLKSWWDLVYSATLLEIKDETLINLDLTFSK
jgi:polyisoprenoid-binding protein YceI